MIVSVVIQGKTRHFEHTGKITEDCQSYDCDKQYCRAQQGQCCQHCNNSYTHRLDPTIQYVKSRYTTV